MNQTNSYQADRTRDHAPMSKPKASENGLAISKNGHYLIDALTGDPIFILADTAWNINALTFEEIDVYLGNRAGHGFNAVMFALDFSPQADKANVYGEQAYIGPDNTDLNPAYFDYCDYIVNKCLEFGIYPMLVSMWSGTHAGIMNFYSTEQLHTLGKKLGERYKAHKNVIFIAGGEGTPPYVDIEHVEALGSGLKEGCEGNNLVITHPCGEHSTSEFFKDSSWLDFYMNQVKSGTGSDFNDVPYYVSRDYNLSPVKPTITGENRYESGNSEDPVIQRNPLYLSVFAGAFGHAYGHNALWQMTPHTAQPWMLEGWNPGVAKWTEALDTEAVRQLKHIKTLLYSRPYLERIPDQSLVLSGQGEEIKDRVQATRDGTQGLDDATYIMAYIGSSKTITLKTSVICDDTLNAFWFDPRTGAFEVIQKGFLKPEAYTLDKRSDGLDWVVVIEDAAKEYTPL